MSLAFGLAHPHWFQLSGKFNPLSLFNAGEQGIAVPDLTPGNGFLFQDSAGTTPVTAYEQPVGLILDQSKGSPLSNGPRRLNLLTYSEDFSNATWANLANRVVVADAASSPNNTVTADRIYPAFSGNFVGVYQTFTGTVASYTLTIYAKAAGKNFLGLVNYAGAAAAAYFDLSSGTVSNVLAGYTAAIADVGNGWYRCSITGTAAASLQYAQLFVPDAAGNPAVVPSSTNGIFVWGADLRLTADAAVAPTYQPITASWIATLPGNHLIQATSTKRPTLSARYNLLTYSEDFSNAAWTKTNATPVANAGVAPDFTNTATLVYPTTTGTGRGAYATLSSLQAGSYVGTIYAKAAGLQSIRIIELLGSSVAGVVNLNTGAVSNVLAGYTVTTTSAGGGWWLISVVGTVTSGTRYFQFVITDNAASSTATTNGTDGVLIWRPDLRLTIDTIGQPAYQRVGAATDYDTAGFFPYLRFDGVDDSMATAASVDFTGTDKMTVFAGVTKLSDAALGMILEFTTNATAFNGTYWVLSGKNTGASPDWGSLSRGTSTAIAETSGGYAAPNSSVLAIQSSISDDTLSLRVNGTSVATSASDQGTGNYNNAPVFLGARNNASLFFNGRVYPFFIRGAATDAGLISQTEQFLKTRTGVPSGPQLLASLASGWNDALLWDDSENWTE